MKQVSILLADDHTMIRQGLKALLEHEPEFVVVGEAGDGIETLKMVDTLKPDVLVLDIGIPGLGGIEVTRELQRRSTKTRIVILTMQDDESFVVEALKLGALGFVLKQSGSIDLVKAVREAMAGRHFLSSPFSDVAIRQYLNHSKSGVFDVYDTLTPREKQVFQLVAEGCTNADIAKRLSISQRTVEVHRASAMRKLGLHSHVDLVSYAMRKGLIPQRGGSGPTNSGRGGKRRAVG